jgi:shikimate kinase
MSDKENRPISKATLSTEVRPFTRNVYLIGYRGTGKSTVARLLGQQLGLPTLDMDELIEARSGLSIRSIFAQEGERGFRQRESAILNDVGAKSGCIVATGGGIVLDVTNRQCLRKSGTAAWLTADAATIWQRMQADSTTWDRRPNLSVGGLEEVKVLLVAREPLYRECADCTVDTTNRSPEEVAALVRAGLKLG